MAKKKSSKKRALIKAREEEEARRLAEELERQRIQREQHEREEQERLKQEEAERRGREIDEYHALLGRYANEVRETKRTTTHETVWNRFLTTGRQQPDPTNLHDMNFLVTRWRDRRDYGDRQALFQTMNMCFWSLNVMQERMWGTIEFRWSEQTMADLLEVFDQMCATMLVKFDLATYHALENYNKLVDTRTEIASTEFKGEDFTYALWSPAGQQLMVPPDADGFYSLSSDSFKFEFPKTLGTSIALRYLKLPFEIFCQEGTNHLFRALWQIQNACFDNDRIALDDNEPSMSKTAEGAPDLSINVVSSDTAMPATGGEATAQKPTMAKSNISTTATTKSPLITTTSPGASKVDGVAALQSSTSMQQQPGRNSSTTSGITSNITPQQPEVAVKSALKDELEAFVQQEEQSIARFTAAFGPIVRSKSAMNAAAAEAENAEKKAAEDAAAGGSPMAAASKAVLNASASTLKPGGAAGSPSPAKPAPSANLDASKVAVAKPATTPAPTVLERSSKRSSSEAKSKKKKGKGKGKKGKGKKGRESQGNSPSGGRQSKSPSSMTGGEDTKSETSEGSDAASEASQALKRIRVASDVELVAPDVGGGVYGGTAPAGLSAANTSNNTNSRLLSVEGSKPRSSEPLSTNGGAAGERISISPLAEDEFINLQNNIAVGGVHAIELFELPPLPSRVKGTEVTLIDSSPQLQKTNFNMPQMPAELEALDDEVPANVEAKRKFFIDNSIGLRISVPENRQRLYGNSVIAMWDDKHRHWSAAGLMQAVYRQGVIDLRVCNIAPICLFQSKWVALPFKSWKLIPKRLHNAWLYLETSAPESIVIEIGETGQCRLHTPKNLDISTQWMQPNQLIHALIARGMYIFPGLDDDATLDGVAKVKQMPPRKNLNAGEIKAYIAIGMMSGLFEFSHSMWNTSSEFGRDEIVVQYRPAEWWSEFRVQPPSEEEMAAELELNASEQQQQQVSSGAAAAAPSPARESAKLVKKPQNFYFRGSDRQLCLVSNARSMTLNMREHDVQFSRLPSSPFHPDAYHLLVEQTGSTNPELLQQIVRAPLFFSAVYSLLVLTRVLSFTYNA